MIKVRLVMGGAKFVATATSKFRRRSCAVRDKEWLQEARGQRWRNILELRSRRSFLCEFLVYFFWEAIHCELSLTARCLREMEST